MDIWLLAVWSERDPEASELAVRVTGALCRERWEVCERLEILERPAWAGAARDALPALCPCCSRRRKRSNAVWVVSRSTGSSNVRRTGRGVSCSETSISSSASWSRSSSLIALSLSSWNRCRWLYRRVLETVLLGWSGSKESVRLGKPEADLGRMRVERRLMSLTGRVREVEAEAALDARVRLALEAMEDMLALSRVFAQSTDSCLE